MRYLILIGLILVGCGRSAPTLNTNQVLDRATKTNLVGESVEVFAAWRGFKDNDPNTGCADIIRFTPCKNPRYCHARICVLEGPVTDLPYMTQTGNVMRVAGIVQSQSTVAYWPNGNFVPKLTLTRLKVSHVR